MNAIYQRRRDLVCDALAEAGVEVTKPRGTIYVWAPVPRGFRVGSRILRARARASGGRRVARRSVRAER